MAGFIDLWRSGAWLTRERLRLVAVLLLAATVLGAGFLAVTSDGLNDRFGRPLGTDFSNVYAAGTYVLDGQPAAPFDPRRQYAREQAIFGAATPFYGWHYPPFFLGLAAPVTASAAPGWWRPAPSGRKRVRRRHRRSRDPALPQRRPSRESCPAARRGEKRERLDAPGVAATGSLVAWASPWDAASGVPPAAASAVRIARRTEPVLRRRRSRRSARAGRAASCVNRAARCRSSSSGGSTTPAPGA